MKNILKYINIFLVSIIYLLGSGVFSHTMAMEDDMKMSTTMECCEFHDTSPKSIHSPQSSHCLGYEDGKTTNKSYDNNNKTSKYTYINSSQTDIYKNIGLSSLYIENNTIQHTQFFHDQKFLQFSDLVGIIILLC